MPLGPPPHPFAHPFHSHPAFRHPLPRTSPVIRYTPPFPADVGVTFSFPRGASPRTPPCLTHSASIQDPNPAPTPPNTSKSLYVALEHLQNDEQLADITIIGNDQSRHRAVKALLAARSEFFKLTFYGSFKEATTEQVDLPYSSTVISDVLTYIYTDRLPPLHQRAQKRQRYCTVDRLAHLLIAADYLTIPALLESATVALYQILQSNLNHVCKIFQQVPPHSEIAKHCRTFIRNHPAKCLKATPPATTEDDTTPSTPYQQLAAPCLALDYTHMNIVVTDQRIRATERSLFEIIFIWASNGLSLSSIRKQNLPIGLKPDEWHRLTNDSRWRDAEKLASTISLERSKPSFISEYVRQSKLIPEQMIRETYEKLALSAEKGCTFYDTFRATSTFTNGNKKVSSDAGLSNFAIYPRLYDGRHEWTFRVRGSTTSVWFGLCHKQQVSRYDMFASGRSGWAFSLDGKIAPSKALDPNERIIPVHKSGLVKLIVNLSKTGTFSFMMHDKVTCLYTNLSKVTSTSAKSVLPCVAIGDHCDVELVDERHVD